MKNLEPKEAWTEVKCPACFGIGYPTIKQPKQADRKIYPARCVRCSGKGRILTKRKWRTAY